jgi:hypothetical protein
LRAAQRLPRQRAEHLCQSLVAAGRAHGTTSSARIGVPLREHGGGARITPASSTRWQVQRREIFASARSCAKVAVGHTLAQDEHLIELAQIRSRAEQIRDCVVF